MQVGGDIRAFLRPHPGLALLAEVGGEPEQPRPHHEAETDDAERRGQSDVEGHGQAARAQREESDRPDEEQQAGADPQVGPPCPATDDGLDRAHPSRRVEPALALRLVGLPPQQRDPRPREQERSECQRLAGGHRGRQQHPDGDRSNGHQRSVVGQPAFPAAITLALPGRRGQARAERVGVPAGRQEQPQPGVQHGAEAPEGDQSQEPHPHPQHREADVLGHTRGDAADPPVVGRPVGASGRERGRHGVHEAFIVSPRPPRSHQVTPLTFSPEESGPSPIPRRTAEAHDG